MKVRCINNSEGRVALSIGKEYEVNFERTNKYRVVNDLWIIAEYPKKRFEVVKEDKEMIEKTFREVIADIKEGETWVSNTAPISFIRLGECGALYFNANAGVNLKCKYKLQRKEYTFEEAFNAYEKGEEIESCYSQFKYKKANGVDSYSRTGNNWYEEESFEIDEIRGKWYINS